MNENELPEPIPPSEDFDEEEDREALETMLNNPEALLAYGYRLAPKGAMCGVFMRELGYLPSEAEALAQKVEDAIFLAKYIYVHQDEIELVNPKDQHE